MINVCVFAVCITLPLAQVCKAPLKIFQIVNGTELMLHTYSHQYQILCGFNALLSCYTILLNIFLALYEQFAQDIVMEAQELALLHLNNQLFSSMHAVASQKGDGCL